MSSDDVTPPVHVSGSPARCPFCRDDLSDVARVVACAACGARLHGECYDEHARCPTCGATDVLVPRAPPPEPWRPLAPPHGCRLRRRIDGEEVVYAFRVGSTADVVGGLCLAILIFTLPLVLRWLLRCYRGDEVEIRLTREAITFPSVGGGFGLETAKEQSCSRARLTRAELREGREGLQLVLHAGRLRHTVTTGFAWPCLTAYEHRWLAETIEAWRSRPWPENLSAATRRVRPRAQLPQPDPPPDVAPDPKRMGGEGAERMRP